MGALRQTCDWPGCITLLGRLSPEERKDGRRLCFRHDTEADHNDERLVLYAGPAWKHSDTANAKRHRRDARIRAAQ